MIESTINGIFPVPIYMSKLGRSFTKKELSLIKKSKIKSRKNIGNITSDDNYVLNNKLFNSLKKI
jgi:hypothetical protein